MKIAQISRNPKTDVEIEVEGKPAEYELEMRGNVAVLKVKRIPYKHHISRVFGLR